MPMKGRFPIRRTLEYLQKGDIIFKNRVKIMTVNYNTHGELSEGARSEHRLGNRRAEISAYFIHLKKSQLFLSHAVVEISRVSCFINLSP